jgi:hypothetical protein
VFWADVPSSIQPPAIQDHLELNRHQLARGGRTAHRRSPIIRQFVTQFGNSAQPPLVRAELGQHVGSASIAVVAVGAPLLRACCRRSRRGVVVTCWRREQLASSQFPLLVNTHLTGRRGALRRRHPVAAVFCASLGRAVLLEAGRRFGKTADTRS